MKFEKAEGGYSIRFGQDAEKPPLLARLLKLDERPKLRALTVTIGRLMFATLLSLGTLALLIFPLLLLVHEPQAPLSKLILWLVQNEAGKFDLLNYTLFFGCVLIAMGVFMHVARYYGALLPKENESSAQRSGDLSEKNAGSFRDYL